jgi:hypothetical protein
MKVTNKQTVLLADSTARADYYELLRGQGKPCWFIRSGMQGSIRSDICASPREAWKDSAERLRAALRKTA